MTALRASGATDVGLVRTVNEDQLLVADPLFAVADGMGGHAAGEVASLIAVEALKAGFEGNPTADGLSEAVRTANRAVLERSLQDPDLRGMGTTVTALALVEEDGEEVLAVVNVGDSRAYLLRDGDLDQLTDDHSVPEELRRAGQLTPAEAAIHPQRNVLTRALGVEPEVEVDCFRITPYRGDRVVLASDGLNNELPDEEIAAVLRRTPEPDEAARVLVRMAKEHGGADNITVVVVDVEDDDDRAARASQALASEPPPPPGSREPAPEEVAEEQGRPAEATPTVADRWRGRRLSMPSTKMIVFIAAVVVVLVAALAAIGWYARAAYYVGLRGDEIVIYKGRPGGLLWFDPTLEEDTGSTVHEVRPSRVDDLREGKEEPSLGQARRYVRNIRAEGTGVGNGTTTTTTTTLP